MIGRFLGPLQLLLCLWVCFVNITPFVYQGWLEAWLVSMGHGTIAAVALLCAIHDQVLLLLLLIFVPFCYYLSIHNREPVICVLAYRPVNYWLCCGFYAVCLPKINEQIIKRE